MKVTTAVVALVAVIGLSAAQVLAHCGKCGPDAGKAEKMAGCGMEAKGACGGEGKAACTPEAKKDCGAACASASAKVSEAKPEAAAHAYGVVDTQALKAMVAAKAPMTLLDARSGKWDDGRRLPGARQLAADASEEAIAAALPDKSALVVAYCSNLKCPASKQLLERLAGLGYSNLLKYPDGIDGWVQAGLEVVKP